MDIYDGLVMLGFVRRYTLFSKLQRTIRIFYLNKIISQIKWQTYEWLTQEQWVGLLGQKSLVLL